MNKRLISALLVLTSFLFSGQIASAEYSYWRPVGNNRQVNISGMALIEHTNKQTSFIVVHDNKKKKQARAGLITVNGNTAPKFTALNWLGKDIPVDLEAVTAIPRATNNFMAFTSAGRIYHIELDRNNSSVKVIKSFNAPSIPTNGNFEGFSLQRIGDTYLAVWAERGENNKAATLFWSKFDLQAYAFTQVSSTSIKVPYPNSNVRHISDVKVDESGKVLISSAADPGNDGPFASAVYLAGKFNLNPSVITFDQAVSLTRLFSVDNRKIEAFEILPEAVGGMVFGTDDENLGSAIYFGRQEIKSAVSLRF